MLPGGITVCDLLELDQIGLTCAEIFVDAVEMRFVPEARPLQFRRPLRSARTQLRDCLDEGGPYSAGSWRRWRADKGISCITRKPATRSRGFSTKRSRASMSL